MTYTEEEAMEMLVKGMEMYSELPPKLREELFRALSGLHAYHDMFESSIVCSSILSNLELDEPKGCEA